MINKKIVLASILLYGSNISAGSMGSTGSLTSLFSGAWNPLISLTIGPTWSEKPSAETLYLQNDIEKTYTSSTNTKTLVSGEVFLGWQHELNHLVSSQLGVAFAATSNASLSGEIWDDADPQFNNFLYSYKLGHTHVAIKGKLINDLGHTVKTYLQGSVGVGFNHAYGFTNTPTIFEALSNPNFSSNTQTAFTYTLGVGLQRQVSEHIQAGIGYEFADWGKNRLGAAEGQTVGTGLSHNHFYTNGLALNITYVK